MKTLEKVIETVKKKIHFECPSFFYKKALEKNFFENIAIKIDFFLNQSEKSLEVFKIALNEEIKKIISIDTDMIKEETEKFLENLDYFLERNIIDKEKHAEMKKNAIIFKKIIVKEKECADFLKKTILEEIKRITDE